MLNQVRADELAADEDLDGVTHHGDLDLPAPNLVPTRQLVPAKHTLPDESTLQVTNAEVVVDRLRRLVWNWLRVWGDCAHG